LPSCKNPVILNESHALLKLELAKAMKKKRSPGSRQAVSNPGPHNHVVNRRNVPAGDLFLYARSFYKAAKTLAASFRSDGNPFAQAEVSAVVFMYRHAVELHLKSIVLGEGGSFLATKPDALSVQKTHSVSWLAQFVCQIIAAVKWEREFKCEGVETLADFKAVVEEVNSVDPGSYVFRCPVDPQSESSVEEFTKKMDAVIGLLESTADALAAEWDLRSAGTVVEADRDDGGFEPTIQ